MLIDILVIISVFLILLSLILRIRIEIVYKEVKRVLRIIDEKEKEESKIGIDPWRIKEFRKVSQIKMYLYFWKPVKSFFWNHKCVS